MDCSEEIGRFAVKGIVNRIGIVSKKNRGLLTGVVAAFMSRRGSRRGEVAGWPSVPRETPIFAKKLKGECFSVVN